MEQNRESRKNIGLTRWTLGTPFVFVIVMETHPSVLAWKNPTDRGAWGLLSMEHQSVEHDLAAKQQQCGGTL